MRNYAATANVTEVATWIWEHLRVVEIDESNNARTAPELCRPFERGLNER